MNSRTAWKGKRVLVTGAGGFIGSHLTEALIEAGAKVRALVRYNSQGHWGHLEPWAKNTPQNLEVILGDIRDPHFVRTLTQSQDIVFHLAALIAIPFSYVAPHEFIETNILGTLNILEGCRQGKVQRLVHTSTSEVYGSARFVPINETHPLQGQSPYSASKIAADKLVESYSCSFKLPVVTVRPFNTFGPRQSARAVIPTILSALLAGYRKLPIGDLRPVRDFTFVRDTVRGFLLAARKPVEGKVINLGTGTGRTIKEIVRLCSQAAGVKMPHLVKDRQRIRPLSSEVWRLICDNRRAKIMLAWAPQVSFEDGLIETAQYLHSHLGNYKPHIYNV